MVSIPGYTFISKPKKSSKTGGGLGIFVKNNLSYKIRPDILNIEDNEHYDGLIVEITNSSWKFHVIIGVFYRSPSFDTQVDFINILKSTFDKISSSSKTECIICGDMNIDLLKTHSDPNASNYLDKLVNNSYLPAITLPTRVTKTTCTLIDHIFKRISCTG